MKRHGFYGLTAVVFLLALTACNDDDETGTPYPSVVTEMADMHTDGNGAVERILTDNGDCFYLTNPRQGYSPLAVYRGLCGYVETTSSGKERRARLATLRSVRLLRDSTAIPQRTDPIRAVSVWRGGEYINLMLSPRTQGGTQYWGYRIDSLKERNHRKHWYLSLHHGQNGDPESYSETLYASLWLKSLPEAAPGDSLWLTVPTPAGLKTWDFIY